MRSYRHPGDFPHPEALAGDRRAPPFRHRVAPASGEACNVIVERQPDGPLIVSFHGAWKTTMAPDPQEAAELIEALRTAVGAP